MKFEKLGILIALLSVICLKGPPAFAEQAKMSDAFVDSIGVNTHLGDTNSPYVTNFPAVVSAISSSGIRHIRDSYWFKADSDRALSLINQVKTNTGVDLKFLIPQDFMCNITPSGVNPAKYLMWGWSVNNISAFEGLNEPQHWCTDWVTTTRNGQQYLWNAVKSTSQISHLPVLGPSLYTAGGQTQTTADAQALGDLTAYMDFGNIHNYTTGSMPSSNNSWLPSAQNAMHGTKKVWTTETGYPQCFVDVTVATKYYSRIFFEFYNFGIQKTYAYELLDTPQKTDCEGTFGLLYGDGRPKPIFNAIKNIISILKDPGVAFTPGSLNYTLSSTSSRLHHTLLQKRDGKFYLSLWLEYSAWEMFSSLNVTVNFPSIMSQVNRFDPLTSATPMASNFNVSSVNVTVGDQVMILEITPSAPTTTTTSTTTTTTTTTTTLPQPSDTVAPTVTITSPANNAQFIRGASISVTASASDNVGVTQVQFYLNNNLVCTDTAAPYQCQMRLPKKRQTSIIRAVARDAEGKTGESSISVSGR